MQLPFQSVLLVDGSSILHRAYHSRPYLTASDGTPSGAVYGAIQWLKSYADQFNPLYIVVALDIVRTSFRNEIYPEYKANRSEREEQLQIQFHLLREFCDAANIPCYDIPEYEADDLLGSLAFKLLGQGYSPYIISGDKDLFQLINNDISSFYLSKDGLELYNVQKFQEKFEGLLPHQLVELKGLQGDNGDNIPGVKGIGPKTAIKMIKDFGTLEKVYENIESFKGKQKENLINDKEMAFLSRKLGEIKTDIELDFDDTKVYRFYSPEAMNFYRKLDIHSI